MITTLGIDIIKLKEIPIPYTWINILFIKIGAQDMTVYSAVLL